MAGWSSSSTRRRSISPAVHITSPSSMASCCTGALGPAPPSPIVIRCVVSNGAYTKSPSATDPPTMSVSSNTARLTVNKAAAASPTPRDFARQRRASAAAATRRSPSAAVSSERVVLRALPATRRRHSSTDWSCEPAS
ncbi:hypothetical protein HPB50_006385 [Hyalomma asiaticum]|uniref:Uncharacterized protein n=1 Tax=Hyalomma asiaticum TaxID=266040 RepID=A0ACB7SSR4_HYAAI|nr:hypothetical protein HPB50_006385 [Hyalomma asiaticum]